MKKVFVTGGAGFIGSNVVKIFSKNSFRVTVYDNLSTGYIENLSDLPNINFIKGDILDKECLIKASENHDIVIHMAANIGNVKSLIDPNFDSTVNILGTLNVLEALKINKIKKIVYSSSAAIFGELLYQPIDEKHPLEPDSPYGVSKLAGEKHCLWFGRHYDIKVVALRYFNVYGENQRYDVYGNVIPIWANLMLQKKPIIIYDDGDQTRDFVNVKDVAYINFLSAIDENLSGYFNVGSGESITINQLADLMGKVFSVKSAKIYKPKRLGEIRHCRADPGKIFSALKFKPSLNLKDGMELYYKWLTK
jgi:UDP-glucose 4-epimerase